MRKDDRFPNLFILDHPLIQHKLSHMRDRTTSTRTFRELLDELTLLMGYEITRDLPLTTEPIETPLCAMDAPVIAGKKVAVVAVLRAGLGMADGLMKGISACTGVPTTSRSSTTCACPRSRAAPSSSATPCSPPATPPCMRCRCCSIVACRSRRFVFWRWSRPPEGVAVFQQRHPRVPVYVASLDSHLNQNAYIVPGLGDAGDRIFGTKH